MFINCAEQTLVFEQKMRIKTYSPTTGSSPKFRAFCRITVDPDPVDPLVNFRSESILRAFMSGSGITTVGGFERDVLAKLPASMRTYGDRCASLHSKQLSGVFGISSGTYSHGLPNPRRGAPFSTILKSGIDESSRSTSDSIHQSRTPIRLIACPRDARFEPVDETETRANVPFAPTVNSMSSSSLKIEFGYPSLTATGPNGRPARFAASCRARTKGMSVLVSRSIALPACTKGYSHIARTRASLG